VKLFIDSNDAREIRELGTRGRIVGVTARCGREADAAVGWPARVGQLAALLDGPLIADVVPGDQAAMLQGARELSAAGANVVVRLPMSVDGLEVVRACAGAGIKTCVASCLTPVQALMAAKAGAAFVETPFGAAAGGLNDDKDQVRKMVANLRMYGLATEVLAGPVRNVDQVVDAALVGAHITSAPFTILAELGTQPVAGAGLGPREVSE